MELASKSTYVQLVSAEMPIGIVPLSLLPARANTFRRVSTLIVDGIAPVSVFNDAFSALGKANSETAVSQPS